MIDDSLIILALISIPPMWLGVALPRLIRRPLLLLSSIVLVRSLFGQGVHDHYFIAYISNLIFLTGCIVREATDAIVRWRRLRPIVREQS